MQLTDFDKELLDMTSIPENVLQKVKDIFGLPIYQYFHILLQDFHTFLSQKYGIFHIFPKRNTEDISAVGVSSNLNPYFMKKLSLQM